MAVQQTGHDLSVERLTSSTAGQSSNYQKQIWEREFWRQQRQIDVSQQSEDSAASPDQQKQSEQFSSQQESSVWSHAETGNDTGRIYKHELHASISEGSRQYVKADTSGNSQVKQVVGISMYIQQRDEVISSGSVRDPTPSSVKADRSFSKGMLQVYEDNACLWLGEQSLKNDRSFMKQLKEAINFFGLKLKRLVISGTEMEVVRMKRDLTNNKESDDGC